MQNPSTPSPDEMVRNHGKDYQTVKELIEKINGNTVLEPLARVKEKLTEEDRATVSKLLQRSLVVAMCIFHEDNVIQFFNSSKHLSLFLNRWVDVIRQELREKVRKRISLGLQASAEETDKAINKQYDSYLEFADASQLITYLMDSSKLQTAVKLKEPLREHEKELVDKLAGTRLHCLCFFTSQYSCFPPKEKEPRCDVVFFFYSSLHLNYFFDAMMTQYDFLVKQNSLLDQGVDPVTWVKKMLESLE